MKFSIKNEEGFTLVEVIVAFVLLVIMLYALITVFTTGSSGIFRAGRKSEALFETQKSIDNSIAEGLSNEAVITPHLITFEGHPPLVVYGEVKEEDLDGFTGTIYYFLPSGD